MAKIAADLSLSRQAPSAALSVVGLLVTVGITGLVGWLIFA
jgi:hypothetical protein